MTRRPHRQLDLAARAKRWELDRRAGELQSAALQEQQADQALVKAQAALEAAVAQRHALVSKTSFHASELAGVEAYAHLMRASRHEAGKAAEAASAVAENVRAEMLKTLAERDAYRLRRDQLQRADHRDAQRRGIRELDELWLLNGAARVQERSDED
jgi:hypothetical protein